MLKELEQQKPGGGDQAGDVEDEERRKREDGFRDENEKKINFQKCEVCEEKLCNGSGRKFTITTIGWIVVTYLVNCQF